MSTKKNIIKIIPLTIVALSVLITIILALLKSDEKKQEIATYVPNIKALTLHAEEFRLYAESSGHIKPKTIYPLTFDLSGDIVFLSPYFNNNLIFNEGDTLLRIDSSDYSIARVNAKFKLDEAELEYLKQKAISSRTENELEEYNPSSNVSDLAKNKPQLEKAQSLLNAAKANYEKAELDLKETVFLAPFKGRIINSSANLGQNISFNMNLGTIYSIDQMLIKLPLSVEDVFLLGLDRKNNFNKDILIELISEVADSEYVVNASYMGFSGSINKLSQKIDVTALIDDFSALNLPIDNNMFFNAKIYGSALDEVFLIPNIAVHDNSYVYVIQDNKIFKRIIRVLKKYDNITVVDSGLISGEKINLTRLDYYVDGMDVNILKNK